MMFFLHTTLIATRAHSLNIFLVILAFWSILIAMKAACVYRKKVEFSETDMAGIAHFSAFFRWMEAAEAELFEALGAKLISTESGVTAGWPRVRVSCKYHAPVHFRDEIETHIFIKEVKIRALEYTFRFYRLGGSKPEHVATGSMTTIFALRTADANMIESAAIKPELTEALEALVAQ